jgi:DNA primase
MTRGWVNFRAVKAAVSMEMALANYGVRLHRLDHAYLRGRCPLPPHTSKGSRESFIVNTEKNAWACHSDSCITARDGRIGGNVLDFISAMEGCTIREAALRLRDWFLVQPAPRTSAPHRNPTEAVHCDSSVSIDRNSPLPFALDWIDCSHPYLAERGVDPEVARYFGIGYNRGKGSMEGRLVIPIHDENGFLVAHAGRSIDQTEPRYRFPARFRKSLVLFNLHRAASESKSVIVVEGFFDCFNVHQAGLPCVVALMGCSLSLRQEELLHEHFREVVLLLDGDRAGRAAGAGIAQRLVSKVSTRLIEIPDGSQPDQLGADQIRCLCIPGYF